MLPSRFAKLDTNEKAFVIACIDIKNKKDKENRSVRKKK